MKDRVVLNVTHVIRHEEKIFRVSFQKLIPETQSFPESLTAIECHPEDEPTVQLRIPVKVDPVFTFGEKFAVKLVYSIRRDHSRINPVVGTVKSRSTPVVVRIKSNAHRGIASDSLPVLSSQ